MDSNTGHACVRRARPHGFLSPRFNEEAKEETTTRLGRIPHRYGVCIPLCRKQISSNENPGEKWTPGNALEHDAREAIT